MEETQSPLNAGDMAFDPLAPISFDEEESFVGYYDADQIPPIAEDPEAAAAERRRLHPPVELTPAEKVAKAIKGMPGQKKLLLHIVDFCREERADSEIVEEIVAFEHGGVNVYRPETIVSILEQCGALRQTNKPVEPNSDDPDASEDAGFEPAENAPDAPSADDAATEGESPAESAKTDLGDGGKPQEAYLQVTKPEPARYQATEEGLAAVEAEDPSARFEQFMEMNAVYAPIFRTILEHCDCDGGQTKKELDALVDHDPLCKKPRRFSGYFIDKLEDADAIAFEGTWRTTEQGRAMLGPDGLIGSL